MIFKVWFPDGCWSEFFTYDGAMIFAGDLNNTYNMEVWVEVIV